LTDAEIKALGTYAGPHYAANPLWLGRLSTFRRRAPVTRAVSRPHEWRPWRATAGRPA